ncbi:MAG: FtsH protease activity modulator HflK [Paracoccaceae bacterium]
MAGSGGPWGGGSDNDDDNRGGGNRGGRGQRPGEGGQLPEIDELFKKSADQLRVLMGGRGNRGGAGGPGGSGPDGGSFGPGFSRNSIGLGLLAALGLWAMASFYSVRPEEKSVELFLGSRSAIGEPGLNFAPWPLYTYEVIAVTTERTEGIGLDVGGKEAGLMLTGDENIVDIDFQVVWNISDPEKYLFNLRDPDLTIRAVAESSMREIIAQSQLAPILNRDRTVIATRLHELIQDTLDSYDSGLNIVRVNFDRADPPREVINAFKEVQSAEQERDRLQKEADAYSNKVVAGARGEAAQQVEQAEAYRAQVVNQAEGEASRFAAVLTEYQKAPDVTRKRLYLETIEEVMGNMNKIILEKDKSQGGGQEVVPYLPLNELLRPSTATTGGGAN